MKYKAVIFDLDGVITKTAKVHSRAWKRMFDEFLRQYAKENNKEFAEFSHEKDYLPYVDGKPRYKGVEDFLLSRDIHLPLGEASDSEEEKTVCGLGNRKNMMFHQVLEQEGVEVYESTVSFIRTLKEKNIKIGVASSSKNCKKVLETAGLLSLFQTRVDGLVSLELGLKGKPEPDIFLRAAKNLSVKPHESIVVEDAVSGVQAGRNGDFALVVGVAREENNQELYANGADIVVSDINELSFEMIDDWFTNGMQQDSWKLIYHGFEKEKEKSRESLLAVGNGYFVCRGAMEEFRAEEYHYPGTYMPATYNRLQSKVNDKWIENEDFVNCPNWTKIDWKTDKTTEFRMDKLKALKRTLHFKNSLLERQLLFTDKSGQETKILSYRIADMQHPHFGALRYEVCPVNYSGQIEFELDIDGNIINDGVPRYRGLNQKHLQAVEQHTQNEFAYVKTETSQSKIQISETVKHIVYKNGKKIKVDFKGKTSEAYAGLSFQMDFKAGDTICVEKILCINNSKLSGEERGTLAHAKRELEKVNSFNDILIRNENAWQKIWQKIDVEAKNSRMTQKLLRLHAYHLMISFSPHSKEYDSGFTPRGLHGEAYRGHVFWDEVFIMPFYNKHFPEIAKADLMYRYRRLEEAKEHAQSHGYKGAMYPWQSGSSGREETQIIHLNPKSGKWGKDFSSLQRHVSLAIAYNIYQYVNETQDVAFWQNFGAEMYFEIGRFWQSKCIWNEEIKCYEIDDVMGPDEFHEKYPNRKEGGLKNNAYTNVMAAWLFSKAEELTKYSENPTDFIKTEELKQWQNIRKHLKLNIKDGVIEQFDGYFQLKELDWQHYKKKYGDIHRMDRILKSENLSPDDFKVAKQADTLMIFYLLDEETVKTLIEEMGYELPPDFLLRNFEYYFSRTSHGSTLSMVVHAYIASLIQKDEVSEDLFQQALKSDYNDIQGGTTAEGIHAGVMASTILHVMRLMDNG